MSQHLYHLHDLFLFCIQSTSASSSSTWQLFIDTLYHCKPQRNRNRLVIWFLSANSCFLSMSSDMLLHRLQLFLTIAWIKWHRTVSRRGYTDIVVFIVAGRWLCVSLGFLWLSPFAVAFGMESLDSVWFSIASSVIFWPGGTANLFLRVCKVFRSIPLSLNCTKKAFPTKFASTSIRSCRDNRFKISYLLMGTIYMLFWTLVWGFEKTLVQAPPALFFKKARNWSLSPAVYPQNVTDVLDLVEFITLSGYLHLRQHITRERGQITLIIIIYLIRRHSFQAINVFTNHLFLNRCFYFFMLAAKRSESSGCRFRNSFAFWRNCVLIKSTPQNINSPRYKKCAVDNMTNYFLGFLICMPLQFL